MEDELLLEEFNKVLQPAIDTAWTNANRNLIGNDPRHAFLDELRVQIDNTKVDLSNVIHKLDLFAQKNSFDFNEMGSPPAIDEDFPNVDIQNYVKETQDGFDVWNGYDWVSLSKKANVKVVIFKNEENQNKPAIKVWAVDSETKTEVLYIDNDIVAFGWNHSITRTGDFEDPIHEMVFPDKNWEDPTYQNAKRGLGILGRSSGALAMRHVGNLTPWNKGDLLKNADGWYRNKEGLYQKLSNQRGRGGGGYQKSAKRAAGKAKIFKNVSRKLFYVGAAISLIDAGTAYYNDDANKGEVATKAALDITFGAIGVFGGPIGWVISGAYFLFDLSGGMGDFGKPMGISSLELKTHMRHTYEDMSERFRYNTVDLDFEVDYCPSTGFKEQYWEEREVKIDNLRVAQPKTLFLKY